LHPAVIRYPRIIRRTGLYMGYWVRM
jgi:hypothetical protein